MTYLLDEEDVEVGGDGYLAPGDHPQQRRLALEQGGSPECHERSIYPVAVEHLGRELAEEGHKQFSRGMVHGIEKKISEVM